jgi:hypothetical protein
VNVMSPPAEVPTYLEVVLLCLADIPKAFKVCLHVFGFNRAMLSLTSV